MAEWTDERMDDLAKRVDAGFARTEREIVALRTEMREGFRDVRTEFKGDMDGLRTELKGDMDGLRTELKGDIGELRTLIFRFGIALMICLLGLVATLAGAIVTGTLTPEQGRASAGLETRREVAKPSLDTSTATGLLPTPTQESTGEASADAAVPTGYSHAVPSPSPSSP
jgi:hypothetical protein